MKAAKQSAANRQILLVEDEGIVATDIEYSLTYLGYRVAAIARSGEQAIEQAERLRPDLVLMDIRLDGQIDGVEAARHIGSQFDIPVVFLSGSADNNTLDRVKMAEPLGYIIKPYREADLRVTIEIALYKHKMEKELRKSHEALKRLSLTDELTGLHNRRAFFVLAEEQLKLARRTKSKLLLVFADLDGLKRINDTFGHPEGSFALQKTAEILRDTFRQSDIVARLGGDEFAVLAIDVSDSSDPIITSRLEKKLNFYNERNGRGYDISLSIGIRRFDHSSTSSIEKMLEEADRAMYEQKVKNATLRP